MLAQIILSFFATLCFAVMFNVPKSELVLAGIVGAWGWTIYQILYINDFSLLISTFSGSVAVTLMSRFLATIRKTPVTLFLISGIIPLVPGTGLYDTMYYTIKNYISIATAKGIETFKIAGIISIGIMIVLALPASIFSFGRESARKTI